MKNDKNGIVVNELHYAKTTLWYINKLESYMAGEAYKFNISRYPELKERSEKSLERAKKNFESFSEEIRLLALLTEGEE